jgi:7-cyano-7-deazaguanine tRNA-ribosyltransferase
MNDYRYADMIDVVAGAKRGLGADAPVHLFGAGHPMMFALAVAMGCDLFDSAAYALYARDERYLTVRGTEHLDELEYFPCQCPVCCEHTPAELRSLDRDETERLLAEHNLHVTFGEMRTIKQAIRQGNLLELVESRARAHPAMLDGYRAMLDHVDHLEATDPVSKDAFFHLSTESAFRPEVQRYHDRLARFDLDGSILLVEGSPNDQPDESFDERWHVRPPFGPVPDEIAQTYPLTAELPARLEPQSYEQAAAAVARLAEANPDAAFTLVHDGWPETALDRVPESVSLWDSGASR